MKRDERKIALRRARGRTIGEVAAPVGPRWNGLASLSEEPPDRVYP